MVPLLPVASIASTDIERLPIDESVVCLIGSHASEPTLAWFFYRPAADIRNEYDEAKIPQPMVSRLTLQHDP